MENNSKKLALAAYEALEDKKAGNIQVIEIGTISPVADYFLIADGSSSSQLEAMVDSVSEKLQLLGADPKRVEGNRNNGWILMDYGDIVVHVFSTQDRKFYDLERVWRDGKTVTKEELGTF